MDYLEESLKLHKEWRGKLSITPKAPVADKRSLALAYTPGVARPCAEIAKNPEMSWELTGRGNTVAVVTDGTAVLGLGDIGPLAAMPVMEGKCVLFKAFGGIDAVPICLNTKSADEIVRTVTLLAPSFGGINLEDISAPRCFEIERRLKQTCDIPIFHDDQHGTAVVVLAALLNARLLLPKDAGRGELKIVISGAGAAGTAIAKLLIKAGFTRIIMCDKSGVIRRGDNLSEAHEELAKITNPDNLSGDLAAALRGANVFIGVSAGGLVSPEMARSMASNPILFPMANPVPEIMPDAAAAAGAFIVGTGRSDFPNQINNVLAFPGIMRGALDCRALDINEEMKMAAALAISELVSGEARPDYILPPPFDPRVGEAVARAVAAAARESGVARIG
ncbi:MAG: NADP-dependent malic enzyme [Clostridiales bacterium]|jgi:malate dehydrogenase (oxaloacetate-decarboxylating)|nr:NADP-dependent malic enzyme [Clostridiales bacterium]